MVPFCLNNALKYISAGLLIIKNSKYETGIFKLRI